MCNFLVPRNSNFYRSIDQLSLYPRVTQTEFSGVRSQNEKYFWTGISRRVTVNVKEIYIWFYPLTRVQTEENIVEGSPK